ncbi:MAG: hypothetical protein ABI947_17525 [Chloroflexota bacterium]
MINHPMYIVISSGGFDDTRDNAKSLDEPAPENIEAGNSHNPDRKKARDNAGFFAYTTSI